MDIGFLWLPMRLLTNLQNKSFIRIEDFTMLKLLNVEGVECVFKNRVCRERMFGVWTIMYIVGLREPHFFPSDL